MTLNDLLTAKNIDPKHVLVLRHRPFERELNRVLPWLAADRPEIFNAYQQTQGAKLEKAMQEATHVASFIAHGSGLALFIGLYLIGESKPLSQDEYWQVPAYAEMRDKFGMKGFVSTEDSRTSILWFDLRLADFYAAWKGKLIIRWPPPERSWWRRAHRNEMAVHAILEDSVLDAEMPSWDELVLTWEQISVLPLRWQSALKQWRAIYYIFDSDSKQGYVGSAYGESNLLGRWQNYADSGHGGNSLLRKRNPRNFRFSILQRVSPDMDKDDVIGLENTWKMRLNTRQPFGLNDN